MDYGQDIRQAVGRMSGETAKSCLRTALHYIRMLKDGNDSPGAAEEAVARLVGLHDRIVDPMADFDGGERFWEPKPGAARVHIVTGDSFAGSLRLALREIGWTETDKLVVLGDQYAIGPLGGLDAPEGRRKRSEWFRNNISEAFEAYGEADVEEAHARMLDRLNRIPEHAEVIIWASRSVNEQLGLRHAAHLLLQRDRPKAIRVVDPCAVSEALHRRPDVSFLYRRSGELSPEKLKDVLKRLCSGAGGAGGMAPSTASPDSTGTDGGTGGIGACNAHAGDAGTGSIGCTGECSAEELARLSAEWLSISEQGGVLRIYEDGTVREVPAEYFDSYLLEKLDQIQPPAGDGGFVKCARLIGEAIGDCGQDIGDSWFEYRVRELIYAGVLEIKGVPAAMRYYGVRRRR